MNNEINLKTVQMNVFSRWNNIVDYEGQDIRMNKIPEAIYNHPKLGEDVDIITINEAWCPLNNPIVNAVMCGFKTSRNILTKNMKKYGWKYISKVVDNNDILTLKKGGSGIIIYSKWPIIEEKSYIFNTCDDIDCLASKGVSYIQILKRNKNGKEIKINIIATHLQANPDINNIKIQEKQLKEIQENFIPSINISNNKSDVLIYQGDFNIDIRHKKKIENILCAKIPKLIGKEKYTLNTYNYLVGKDGLAKDARCLTKYKKNFKKNSKFTKNSKNKKCPCCPNMMLDYIIYSNNKLYLQPIKSNIEIIPIKSIDKMKHRFGFNKDGLINIISSKYNYLEGYELSDHYPVVGNFTFIPNE